MTTRPTRGRGRCPMHGERQRAASAVVDVDAEPAQGVEDPGHRPGAGVRVAVEGDRSLREGGHRRDEAHHRAGQAAVDDPPRAVGPGVTDQSGPGGVDWEPRAVSAAAISSVSRDRSARRTTEGPSASAARTSARLVSDFEPGQLDPGVDRARGDAARATGRVCGRSARLARHEAIGRATSRRVEPRAWPAWPGGAPRVGRPAPRASPARRRPGRPSVSTAASSRPPSIERFLKKWSFWLAP